MTNFEGPRPPMTPSEAMQKILEIERQIMTMGANDFEPSSLESIKERLENGKFEDPAEAVKEALNILKNKQDYH